VPTASADECARKLDELLGVAKAWQPTMVECVGALIWMTPTLNGYFDDWRNSRCDPVAAEGRYVAESRVLDMQGIVSSLALVCNAILPRVQSQNLALANQLKYEYDGILSFLQRADDRDKRSGGKMSVPQIEELAFQAKRLTDQLDPHPAPTGRNTQSQDPSQTNSELITAFNLSGIFSFGDITPLPTRRGSEDSGDCFWSRTPVSGRFSGRFSSGQGTLGRCVAR
jgi:hypothetical protein